MSQILKAKQTLELIFHRNRKLVEASASIQNEPFPIGEVSIPAEFIGGLNILFTSPAVAGNARIERGIFYASSSNISTISPEEILVQLLSLRRLF
jgi:hypothetical protein